MLNSVGLANPGLEQVRARDLPWLSSRLPGPESWSTWWVQRSGSTARSSPGSTDAAPVVAWEINLSCPNTSAGGVEFGADPGAVERIIAACRAVTRRALVAKLSPVLPDIPAIAAAAVDAGADGISVVNTMPGYLAEGSTPDSATEAAG